MLLTECLIQTAETTRTWGDFPTSRSKTGGVGEIFTLARSFQAGQPTTRRTMLQMFNYLPMPWPSGTLSADLPTWRCVLWPMELVSPAQKHSQLNSKHDKINNTDTSGCDLLNPSRGISPRRRHPELRVCAATEADGFGRAHQIADRHSLSSISFGRNGAATRSQEFAHEIQHHPRPVPRRTKRPPPKVLQFLQGRAGNSSR